AELVAEFYRQLEDRSVSRAVALQRAQVKLLDNPRYDHPGFWAPFLLINNWLYPAHTRASSSSSLSPRRGAPHFAARRLRRARPARRRLARERRARRLRLVPALATAGPRHRPADRD